MSIVWVALAEQGNNVSPSLVSHMFATYYIFLFVMLMHLCCSRSGAAVTLVTRENWKMACELIPILERGGQVSRTGISLKVKMATSGLDSGIILFFCIS